MNIGFDAKRALMNNTGLGNYSRSVIEALQHQYPENKFFLFSPQPKKNLFPTADKSLKFCYPKSQQSLLSSYWRSFGITNEINQHSIDVYHGLSNELPFTISKFKGKKIVTIHDLIFLRYPNWYPTIDSFFYDLKFKFACNNADIIIATSTQTKNDIIQFYKIDEQKIKVVYQNCDDNFKTLKTFDEKKKVKEKYHLPQNFILYVGTISERKNLLSLVKAYQILNNQELSLVVIGNGKQYLDKVNHYIQQHKISGIHFLKNLEFEDFPAIYQQANCLVYPSLIEGFGIPVLEGMYSEIPIITSNTTCFEEIGKSSIQYINPLEPDEIANTISKINNSSDLKSKLIQEAKKIALTFNNTTMANELMEIYKK